MSAFQHLQSKKHKLGSLWFNAISANQEALLNLQCKYQAGKQRLWGIRTMNQPLPSLRSFLRNISTFQPSCCLVPTHLLQYKTSSSITNITFWRETTHWTYSFPAALLLQEKKAQHAQRHHSYLLDITAPWTLHLLLAFIFMVTYSKSCRFLTVKPLVLAVG